MTTDNRSHQQMTAMDIQEVTQRILFQRMSRFNDPGPELAPLGTARYRREGARVRVGFAAIAPGAAYEAVARVQRYASGRGMQVQWVVVPERPGERELPGTLLAARFRPLEHLTLMAHAGPVEVQWNPTVVVEPITTWQAMWHYEYGSRQAFFDEPDPSPNVVNQRARERWREQEYGWCRYYTASMDGRMVGGCYISLWEEIPTLMGVYTVPEARGRGVATAAIARTVADTIRPGRDVCCLFVKVGNPAERLYRELGFVRLVSEDTYVWDPDV
jgi:GNAT superfamily N-acetyltransferase